VDLLADRLDPGNPAFKVPVGIRLRGPLDVRILQRSLREVVLRHEALRTTFVEVDGVPMQVVGPASGSDASTFDVSHLPADEREAEAARIAIAEVQRPLDLATGPLFGAAIIRLDAERHVLVLAPHHISGDGWSLAVLIGELATLYATFEQAARRRCSHRRGSSASSLAPPAAAAAEPAPRRWLLAVNAGRPAAAARPADRSATAPVPVSRHVGDAPDPRRPVTCRPAGATEHATRFMALLAALHPVGMPAWASRTWSSDHQSPAATIRDRKA
jgi:hypothetical protein